MTVRSRALAVLGFLLLASGGLLAAALAHDAASAPSDLAQARPGDRVTVKGSPEPFSPSLPLHRWGAILPLLQNATSVLDGPDVAVLLTGPRAAPVGATVAHGTVAWAGPHPDGSGRTLVLVQVDAWRQPILR